MKPCTKRLILLGPFAQFALVLSVLLQRWGGPSLDFWTGLLTGFSIVGNLASIYAVGHWRRSQSSP